MLPNFRVVELWPENVLLENRSLSKWHTARRNTHTRESGIFESECLGVPMPRNVNSRHGAPWHTQ